jgi:outer membrane protein assembly factor BamB
MKTLYSIFCLGLLGLQAQQLPVVLYGFRGSSFDGKAEILKNGIQKPQRALWTAATPLGFSSLSVVGGRLFTLTKEEVDGNTGECLVCMDAVTGKRMWIQSLSVASYDRGGDAGTPSNKGGDGPRSTPLATEKQVYVLDSNLVLYCFETISGKPLWKHDLIAEYAGRNIKWQNAASPILYENIIMVAGGGEGQAILGFNAQTGALVWKGERDMMTHASPVLAKIHGQMQVIFYTQTGLVGIEPLTGKVLWRTDYPFKVSAGASPVVDQNWVYCSAGYGVGAAAFEIEKKADGKLEARMAWRRENACFNHWSTPVVYAGKLYGLFSFKEYGSGPLGCVDLKTGKDEWMQPGFGQGQLIISGDQLVVMNDQGECVIVKANANKYEEIMRWQAVKGKVWSYPSLVNGMLYMRSIQEAACYEIR